MKAVRNAAVASFAAVALFFGPSLAQAAQGFIVNQTELKAGPDEQFPAVVDIQAGASVDVFGCLSGNSWCDVAFQQDRGWVSGQDLEVLFQSKRVKIVEVTTEVVPVVSFEVTTYWTQYYHDKPFFKDRDRFASINININNGGKAAAGKTGSGGQADVTGSINGKVTTGGKAKGGAATGSAEANANANATATDKAGAGAKQGGASGQASATDNNGCPAGQKNCKTEDKAGGGNAMGKSANGAGNAMDKNATGGAVDKNATGGMAAGKTGQGAAPTANANGCKPGTANCAKGGSNGNGG